MKLKSEENPQGWTDKVCVLTSGERDTLRKARNILLEMSDFVYDCDYFVIKVESNGIESVLDKEAEELNLMHATDFLSSI